ncbi:MAG: S-adenosylmethionine:tRNA ribosyltransferase-isomerase [Cyclobacteriaceae bacterium]
MDKSILIKDYWYDLPPDRIAQYPLPERDQSRLLVYKDGTIDHKQFTQINDFLPPQSTLFFNDTKVIPARLFFQKETGAIIEIFLLNPISPSSLVQQAMETSHRSQWECTIGNLKRWPENATLIKRTEGLTISATLINREQGIVEFSWHPESKTFAEVITLTGFTPLPPYLNREAEERDRETYQTIYSHHEGAVAAPTAGLHFTKQILDNLHAKGHSTEFLTLHVSAGTFQPVKVKNAIEHSMHMEQVIVTRKNIEALLSGRSIVAVGTTSMRTLESLYWYGVKLETHPEAPFQITQHDPYILQRDLKKEEAFRNILNLLDKKDADTITGETSIYIVPGYSFKVVEALITNFHQPGSTLILLVAAFIGPVWKKVYQEALSHDYRFLSYGDSSILYLSNV